ncbi:MAG: DEAD/DEAH box helicase [Verrucomicrobiae bacterium]|nr:DEAD/DEAH box helicase [Verrucomicrobiae bacterium]
MKKNGRSKEAELKLPAAHNWKTTDEEEINKRRFRAQTEALRISNTDPRYPVFSTFQVRSPSGLTYSVEIRDVANRLFACDCVDFTSNGLGTCKHVEAVLYWLERRHSRDLRRAENGSPRTDLVLDRHAGALRLERNPHRLPPGIREWFDDSGLLKADRSPGELLAMFGKLRMPSVRVSQEIAPWLENRLRVEETKRLRKEYESRVHAGEWPAHETVVPLYPYQREGMLHLAFTERALLADEMGLGKTIQAIAACALLSRLGKAKHALIVTPASLKTEWEAQIQQFTRLPYQILFGSYHRRLAAYGNAPFFTIVNYEQMVKDALDVNTRLKPDVIILDEAQRIKNWTTKTAQAIKRLKSRYAFVLTGTPIENRIDELHSIMGFLNPAVLGPLFRFNREYYDLDERGHAQGFKNLDRLHDQIRPFMLRRRKADVETELPDRTDKNFMVPMSPQQENNYAPHAQKVTQLANIRKKRALTKKELDRLMIELAMMRMICDTNYILEDDDKTCPKLLELGKIFEECLADPDAKMIVFSEWERMLDLVRGLAQKMGIGYAWHTGSVPQKRRRGEIMIFKSDPKCRLFLSTDAGATGLNLQAANFVVNCDLPWNPAKLEQRIARAWRKHQTRPVTVINLVSLNTIEHRMLGTLASKKALADGVLDRLGDLKEIKFGGGRDSFFSRLEQVMSPASLQPSPTPAPGTPLPVDRAQAFCEKAREQLGGALLLCEERYPHNAPHSVIFLVVNREAAAKGEQLKPAFDKLFGPGQSDPAAPTFLEVIDWETHQALMRLEKSGLIAGATRAARPLYNRDQPPAASAGEMPPELRQKMDVHLQVAARKLKMGRLLAQGDLPDEGFAAVQQGLLAAGKALAVRHALPEPRELDELFKSSHAWIWTERLDPLRHALAQTPPQLPGLIQLTEQVIGQVV